MSLSAYWHNRTFRRLALQGGFVACLGALLITGIMTARANLAAQGMTSGFGFLFHQTAWEMNFALLEAGPYDPYWWFFLMGILNTLFMGVIGLTGASLLGLVVGLMRSGRNPAARLLGSIYIEIFRNLPLIVQLYFWYAVANSLPSPRQAREAWGFLASSRGIYLPGLAVGRGQIEAARALGLTPWQVFSRVRMPLAIRAMLPTLINQYVWLIKATTLGIAVGFSDFFMVIATSITHSGQTLELIGLLMAGFLTINFSLAAVLNRLNRAIALKGNLVGVAT